MSRTSTSFITLLLAASFIIGCGGTPRPDGMPRLYPASITVIQEGTPLEGAMVRLVAVDASLARWEPSGITDASGVAAMRIDGRFDGAPLGNYKVLVSKREQEPHPHPELASLPPGDPNAQRYIDAARNLKTYTYVEPQYDSVENTPLRVEITASQRSYTVDAGKKIRNEERPWWR